MRIAVVIPCFKVTRHIEDVIARIGPEVEFIFAVDDACPDGSGDHIEKTTKDPRVKVLRHTSNTGVGGAVITGYRAALEAGAEILVKVDGDGQMAPELLPQFVQPIEVGEADYAKGNRFYSGSAVSDMPRVRLFGNAFLSFITKLSSGYWSIFDPTNGYTAIHSRALASIDLDKVAQRYFFESDMLIRLGDLRAVVVDIPMRAVYADEVSGLRIGKVVGDFLWRHITATLKRVIYMYFLRDFSLASLNLLFGLILLTFGVIFGAVAWSESIITGVPAATGTVMLSALPIVLGFQMLLFFASYDIASEPKVPIQRLRFNSHIPTRTDKRAKSDN
ncbi:glycosyltransferase family 2 protein [Ruegeria sp.]|uniref:glycosyltransferase family 2 protein n=1 Tax=Ruegeria sp. TaxID=1879320 RepID=UPI0023268C64|nr:glycosyltransferase family 2 protein [Ruegeria sp.]MDA7963939.1 glycosyltransferase family 2 protein [Ruegeria sp.]